MLFAPTSLFGRSLNRLSVDADNMSVGSLFCGVVDSEDAKIFFFQKIRAIQIFVCGVACAPTVVPPTQPVRHRVLFADARLGELGFSMHACPRSLARTKTDVLLTDIQTDRSREINLGKKNAISAISATPIQHRILHSLVYKQYHLMHSTMKRSM